MRQRKILFMSIYALLVLCRLPAPDLVWVLNKATVYGVGNPLQRVRNVPGLVEQQMVTLKVL